MASPENDLATLVTSGGSHAPAPLYRHRRPSPAPRPGERPALPAPARPRPQDQGAVPLRPPLLGPRLPRLDLRRLHGAARRPLRPSFPRRTLLNPPSHPLPPPPPHHP